MWGGAWRWREEEGMWAWDRVWQWRGEGDRWAVQGWGRWAVQGWGRWVVQGWGKRAVHWGTLATEQGDHQSLGLLEYNQDSVTASQWVNCAM